MTEIMTSSSPASTLLEQREASSMLQSGAQNLNSGAINSPTSSVSTSISEASSKASSHISKSTTSTSTATSNNTNKVRSKAPSLDAIAARMKKTTLGDRADGETGDTTQNTNGDNRPSRLPMPGRPHSTISDNSDSSFTMMPPAPIAMGEPPAASSRGRNEKLASLKDKAASRSRSTSPTKPQAIPGRTPVSGNSLQSVGDLNKAASISSSSMGKEMPSLQDIIDRMSKKGIASSSSKSNNIGGSTTQTIKTEENVFKEPTKRSESPVKSDTQAKEQDPIKTADSTKSKASISSVQSKEEKGHPLQHKWTMYFDSKSWNPSTNVSSVVAIPDTPVSPIPGSSAPLGPSSSTANSWEAALKMLGVYTSVESFMSIFSTLRRPSQLERNSNYHLFKDGIKPMWEDAANQNGGKWVITLRGTNTALLDRSWMWLVLALIGEELDDKDDVTGAVVSTRSKGDRIALWIRNKTDVDLVNKIGKKFVMLLDLEKEPGVSLEFSPNTMEDGSGRKVYPLGPSKFISFSNPMATYNSSPNFGGGGGQQSSSSSSSGQHQHSHRLGSSPGKGTTTGNGPISRIGNNRRGSETDGGNSGPFPIGLGGPIGRTGSPGPGKNAMNGSGSGLLAKGKLGLGMSPPR